ncbi:MAG: PQQ-dependent sugar dehydrogenase [Fibrobacteres bacterium]|nr:PQQ-dependent sugar dehydrogenase [Fibrobacterota bacterium]
MHPIRTAWLMLGCATAFPLWAQLTYPGCSALSASDFKAEELFNRKGTNGAAADPTLSEPTRADIRVVNKADGSYDHSDIIFVERTGAVKWYDGVAKKVSLMGTISVHAGEGSQDDNGLMGVVFHPDFENNRWVYLWYTAKQLYQRDNVTTGGQNRQMRMSRFTVKSDNTLDMSSEKNIIKILGSKSDMWHCGGPMTFDSYGDMWFGVGNNSPDLDPTSCDAGNNVLSKTDSTASAEWGPSDTHNMRGSFLRIHPDSSDKGYSVPRGNFGEYWADKFEQQGRTALATVYRDPNKVLPEIYVKGERSNFSITVHPTKRWLGWGTVNYASNNDEFNITNHPIFSGFPYFHNNNLATCNHGKNVNAPVNNSPFHGGADTLPPAIPGTINNLINVAIGGPIYSYDPTIKYPNKFPPHFDNKWIIAGFGRSGAPWGIWAVTVDTTKDPFKPLGTPTDLKAGIFANVPIRNFIGAKYGKDGALYITNYDGDYGTATNPGVVRVTYTGSCVTSIGSQKPVSPYQKIWIDPQAITVGETNDHAVSLYNMAGKRVWVRNGHGPQTYRISAIRAEAGLQAGLYLAKVVTPVGEVSHTLSLF